tara:strand:+ start:137 stop:754 length:618 start_codon:yes stop_codon:yes gene_type:complete
LKSKTKKFIYLISPEKIREKSFLRSLDLVLKSNKIKYFQLRLKKEKFVRKLLIAKKIFKICKKYNVKFIINDDPYLTLKVNADGCHLGQSDMSLIDAKKILKNKLIGITCHNSIKLAKEAYFNKANYVAIGAFYKSITKKVIYRANIKTLTNIKKSLKIPIVAIGGITQQNYKKLLLNKADFLAISSYIWKNKKLKPEQAIKQFI